MSLRENIEVRITDCRSKLEVINRTISEEISRNHSKPRARLLHFLYSEKKAYSLALVELNTVFQDVKEQITENTLPAVDPERLVDCGGSKENKRGNTPVSKLTYRIITWGGIGDVLLTTPTLRMLKQRHPECKIHVYCNAKSHKEALENNPYIDRLKLLSAWSKALYYLLFKLKLIAVRLPDDENPNPKSHYHRFRPIMIQSLDYGSLTPSLFYRKRAAEIIGEMVGVEIDNPRPDCFLTESEEKEGRAIVSKYSNPVAIQVTGKCSPNKSWPIKKWEELVQSNPNYDFLQLGLANEEPIKGATDLRGKTSLRQAFAVIKAANAFVGVDSAFGHVATAFQTPAVILFGASTPVVWGYGDNQNLYNSPRCSPCIDLLLSDPCPYERLCMSNITVSDVERALSLAMRRSAERQE